MNGLLLKGSLDFAFVDDFTMDRRVHTEKVYDETLELCASEEFMKKYDSTKQNRKFFESLEYVDYQEDEAVLRLWFRHHLDARNIDLNVRASVMDVQAISRLISMGRAQASYQDIFFPRSRQGKSSTGSKAAESRSRTRSASQLSMDGLILPPRSAPLSFEKGTSLTLQRKIKNSQVTSPDWQSFRMIRIDR